jgi:hypothetical protein
MQCGISLFLPIWSMDRVWMNFDNVAPPAEPRPGSRNPLASRVVTGQTGWTSPSTCPASVARNAEPENTPMKAVKFDHYGDIDVLEVRDVPLPSPGPNEVLVQVKAAGINPGEAMIRKGALHDRWPATFPSGQGSDLAGVVAEVGASVEMFRAGDEVLGFTHQRASQAEFVVVPANQLTGKPPAVSWEVAGALFVAGTTAYAAIHAVELKPGDTVAVAGAAGGVGSIAVQLAKRAGATVLGIAGLSNDAWLSSHGIIPVNYGGDLARRLRAAAASGSIHAFPRLLRRRLCRTRGHRAWRAAAAGGHNHRLRRGQ